MSKRCAECGTVNQTGSPYCDACGGKSWAEPRTNAFRVLSVLIVVAILSLVAWLYWKGQY
jgi:uncharacterized OB-fold protein